MPSTGKAKLGNESLTGEGQCFGSVVDWLKHQTDDQHSLGSKPTCAILLYPWERHFTAKFSFLKTQQNSSSRF